MHGPDNPEVENPATMWQCQQGTDNQIALSAEMMNEV
jgi:hypothetical protein